MAGRKPYRGSSGHRHGRVPYRGSGKTRTARTPYRGEPTSTKAAAPPPPEKKHHGGFFSTLKHVVTQTPKDLANAAYHAPGGLYAVAKATEADQLQAARHGDFNVISALLHGKHTRPIAKAMAEQTIDTVRHPLRHPGDTILLALPAAGQAAKIAEAGALARAGESASAVTRAATIGAKPGPRILKVGDMEVRGHYSRAAGARAVQRATDRALEKGSKTSVRVENQLHRRAAKWESRNLRTADAVARAPGTMVAALGAKLKPHELRALRLVAEETPVERRVGAQEMRKARARDSKEHGRHQERIDLTRKAMTHLTADAEGRPIFKPGATHLQNVYRAIQRASADREGILKNLDLMDEAAAQAAKTKAARVAAGGTYEAPTPAKLGIPTPALKRTRQRVVRLGGRVERSQQGGYLTPENAQAKLAKLEREHTAALDKIAGRLFGDIDRGEVSFRNRENARAARQSSSTTGASGRKSARRGTVREQMRAEAEKKIEALIAKNPDHPVAKAWAERAAHIDELQRGLNPDLFEKVNRRSLGRVGQPTDPQRHAQLEGALAVAQRDLVSAEKAAAGRVKPTGIVGADDIVASPAAVHIGNPVERTRLRGKPKVSSLGTIGHTQRPSSLKTSTGGSVERALERQDVTNIVAERHAEAVRLGKIDRVVQKYKRAGETTPRRKDDVWMWTDKVVSNERIPREVREYLDNPEAIAALTPDARGSLYDRIRDATFEKHDWQDPDKVAEFQKLAGQGKGVFVPRKLLGEFAKRSYHVGDNPAIRFADAVNNAQKAGLVYLKINYPVVQGVSNAAMNIIHQGFAYPRNLTAAVRLEQKVGPEYAAITDDIMGQGAVVQAQFEGQGAVARGSQKIAHVMSSKVDRPARRAAFYHEAVKAGYGTPDKYRALLTDDSRAGDLAEVAQRAREAIVDYGDMGPVERNIVRRLVFVYPWQKGAVKYSGHFLRDHPVQAAALAQIGELGKERSDATFGPVPSYLEGLIPVGDRAVNPAGVNFFQTPAQIGTAAAGLATGNPAQASAGLGFLAPTPAALAGLLSGRDDIGRPLTGNIAEKARDLTVAQMPGAALGRAAFPDSAVVAALLGDRGASKTFPDPADAYWRFLLGGLYPRQVNPAALNQNAARERTGR